MKKFYAVYDNMGFSFCNYRTGILVFSSKKERDSFVEKNAWDYGHDGNFKEVCRKIFLKSAKTWTKFELSPDTYKGVKYYV